MKLFKLRMLANRKGLLVLPHGVNGFEVTTGGTAKTIKSTVAKDFKQASRVVRRFRRVRGK